MHPKKQLPSEAELLQSIRNAEKWKKALNNDEELNEDWLTFEQICKVLNRGRTQTQIKIKQAIEDGKMEKKKVFVYKDGRSINTAFYRLL
jgi:hypothetical protein